MKPYAAVAAVLTVCAVVVTAYVFTRPAAPPGGAGSAAATASASARDVDHTGPPKSGAPSPSSPSPPSKTPERTEVPPGPDDKPREQARPTPSPAPRTTEPRPTPSTTPPPTPTAPAGPPWLTDCTYYSGTELTRRGDRGQRVLQVQCMLAKRGYDVGGTGVDGRFGKDTAKAVRSFQRDKRLDVDGQVGPRTWAALRSSE